MDPISSQIAQHEQKARARYLSAVQHMGTDQLPDWFKEVLEHSVLPLLIRIGFDREIAASLFRISSPAWRSLRPAASLKIRNHPVLDKDIREIRRNIVSRDEKNPPRPISSNAATPQQLADSVRKAMHPRTLGELLQTIPVTWIILPRAHTFLKQDDSRCLMLYLQQLERETNLAFEKILVRILIEFIGNYSLKFICHSLPKEQMIEAIFYGYAAMFWKNLLQPPTGMEDLLVFRNYLSWAKAFNKRAGGRDAEKEAVIAEMEEMGNAILPDHDARTFARRNKTNADGLRIALRHGRPGISHAVRHFSMGSASLFDTAQNDILNRTLPTQMNSLFRELRNSYDHETPANREFIHTFVMELGSVYAPLPPRPEIFRKTIRDNLAFTRGRMTHLIQDFSQSLH